ncbi:MAG: acetyltransferase [Osedax symbiont Rs1]|nr:MAG: acetyltransferase [Osedax symbiont Rs1]
MIPTLSTERLKLIPPDESCFAAYEQFYTDADSSKAYGGPLSSSQAWERLMLDIGSWHLTGFGVWAIKEQQSGAIVGSCGYWQALGWPRELTWWLLKSARCKGYAQEASIAAIEHAYTQFGWDKVQTYMHDDNQAARSLVEKLGGVISSRMEFADSLSRNIYDIAAPPPLISGAEKKQAAISGDNLHQD